MLATACAVNLLAACFDNERPASDAGPADTVLADAFADAPALSDAAADGDATTDAATDATADAPVLSVAGMIGAACPNGACKASAVIAYWKDAWASYAVKRTVRFKETSTTEYALEITDEKGAPASLTFAVGVPVTLTIVNPSVGSSAMHNLTGPNFYRAVAWQRATTAEAEYRAPHFDAFSVRRSASVDRQVTLYFVPIVQGTSPLYCNTAVPDGARYAELVAGTSTAALTDPAGHAGKGMKTVATIQGTQNLSLDPEILPSRDATLDADPRRYASDPVWANGARDETYRANPIGLLEYNNTEYGFTPVGVNLHKGIGTVLRFDNTFSTNESAHFFTATSFNASTVLRKAQDTSVEVEASYVTGVEALLGEAVEVFVVPTVVGTFTSHCQLGVKMLADGGPNLATGHAGKGMVGSVTVSP